MRNYAIVFTFLLFFSYITPSLASTEISPFWIFLSDDKTSGDLAITNHRDVATQYEIKAFSWEQAPNGDVELNPSDEIHVGSEIITLEPRQITTIKVEVETPKYSAKESTYRVSVRELPSKTQNKEMNAQFLASITVPVFFQRFPITVNGRIENSQVENGHLTFSIRNKGNGHFFVKKISVTGIDDHGHPSFKITRTGWYILADGYENFEATLSRKDCQISKTIVIRASLLDGGHFKRTLDLQSRRCGKATHSEFPGPTLNSVGATMQPVLVPSHNTH